MAAIPGGGSSAAPVPSTSSDAPEATGAEGDVPPAFWLGILAAAFALGLFLVMAARRSRRQT